MKSFDEILTKCLDTVMEAIRECVEEKEESPISEIRDDITPPALFECLAEECTELAHAALKMARVMRGENPTPVDMDIARMMIDQELADVEVVLDVIGIKPDEETMEQKMERWVERIRKEKK